MSNLDTTTGLQIPTMAQVIQNFVAGINENIDPTFAIQNRNILSQIIVILSQELSNLYDTLQVCFDVLDPQTATGQNLIDAVQYVGITPQAALATKVYLLLSAAGATTIPANTQLTASNITISNAQAYSIDPTEAAQASVQVLNAVENQHYTFELDDTLIDYIGLPSDTVQTIVTALVNLVLTDAPLFTAQVDPNDDTQLIVNRITNGDVDYSQAFNISINTADSLDLTSISTYAPFLNSVTGNISVPAGTFDMSSTPVSGISSQQPEDGINGQDADTDQSLRLRRNVSLAFSGNRTTASIEAQLANTIYVQKSEVYQNTSDNSEELDTGITLLPHSIYAVCLGGYKTDIANAIFNTMSEGIQTNGETAVMLQDNQGNSTLVYFDYAGQVPVALNIAVVIDKTLLYKIDKNALANIQNEVFEYIQGLGIGETMYIMSIEGMVGCAVQYGIKSITVSYTLLPDTTTPLTVDLIPLKNQVVVANLDNINVTVSAQ